MKENTKRREHNRKAQLMGGEGPRHTKKQSQPDIHIHRGKLLIACEAAATGPYPTLHVPLPLYPVPLHTPTTVSLQPQS